MKILKCLVVLTLFLFLQSCTGTKVVDVKSPCVSGEDGPCGPRKNINTWMNKQSV